MWCIIIREDETGVDHKRGVDRLAYRGSEEDCLAKEEELRRDGVLVSYCGPILSPEEVTW